MTQETPRFADAMVLHRTEHGFDANLNEHWTIGPKVHGGVMLALCAKAARESYGSFEPVAISADFGSRESASFNACTAKSAFFSACSFPSSKSALGDFGSS